MGSCWSSTRVYKAFKNRSAELGVVFTVVFAVVKMVSEGSEKTGWRERGEAVGVCLQENRCKGRGTSNWSNVIGINLTVLKMFRGYKTGS